MDIETKCSAANTLLFEQTGQHLSTLEKTVLQGALEHKSYKTLAATTYRSAKTLKDVGARLWQKLSLALDVPIKKSNVSAELERYYLSQEPAISLPNYRRDWADAPEMTTFLGRQEELATLKHWILEERCRVVAIVGMRGVGKTGLAVRLGLGGVGKTDLSLQLARGIQDKFDYVIWRSLLNTPSVEDSLRDLLQFLSDHQEVDLPDTLNGQILSLLNCLKRKRCLLLFDNIESVLVGGDPSDQRSGQVSSRAGHYRSGFDGYGQLFQKIAEVSHQSCLILTSRESPKNLQVAASVYNKVRFFQLQGLNPEDAMGMFKHAQRVSKQDECIDRIVRFYDGNPLALNLVQKRIQNVFDGDAAGFLEHDTLFFDDINELLDWHFRRLGKPEQEVLYWLAINRESTPISVLKADSFPPRIQDNIASVLESLQLRVPINKTAAGFTLQPVIIEYLTACLIKQLEQELDTRNIDLFDRMCLQKAAAKTYVRETQQRLIVAPLVEQLQRSLSRPAAVVERLKQVLQLIRASPHTYEGYAAANLITLLCALETDLTGYDFSYLHIRQAYLQDTRLRNVNFSYSDLSTARFNQSFGGVHSLAFSPNGELLAVGDSKGQIQLLRCQDYQQVGLLVGHVQTQWVTSVAFAKTQPLLVSGSFDKTVRVWDMETGTCLKTLTGHTHWIWTIAISPDGRRVASGGDDCTVRLWDIETGTCLTVLTQHSNWVWAVAFSPDGQVLATGSYDRTIRLWDVETGDCLHSLQGHENSIWGLAFSPDGYTLASGSLDYTLRLWDLRTQTCTHILTGHSKEIRSIAFAPDGSFIASGSFDGTLKRWHPVTGQCLSTCSGHRVGLRTIAISPDSKVIATGDHAQSLRIWQASSGYCLQAIQGHTNWVWAIAISPDNQYIASGGLDGLVRLWSLETGVCVQTMKGHDNWIWQVAFSPDGAFLASCGDDETVRLWDVETGDCTSILKGHRGGGVWAIAFDIRRHRLISAGQDGTLRIWDLDTTQELHTIKAHDNWIWSVVLDATCDRVASCSDDGTIRVWDAETYQLLHTLTTAASADGKVLSLEQLGDRAILASGHDDGTIRLWDSSANQQIKVLEGHQGWILSLAFNQADNTLISCGQDNTIRIWQADTGACLAVLQDHQDWVTSVAVSCASNIFITGSTDATLKIWDLQSWHCRHTIKLPLPYDGMNISHAVGLTSSQKANLQALGAVIR